MPETPEGGRPLDGPAASSGGTEGTVMGFLGGLAIGTGLLVALLGGACTLFLAGPEGRGSGAFILLPIAVLIAGVASTYGGFKMIGMRLAASRAKASPSWKARLAGAFVGVALVLLIIAYVSFQIRIG